MQTALNRQEDGTIELTITIPWKKVKENFNNVFEKALSEVEIEGFRKGRAPKKMAKEKVDTAKVYQETVKETIPVFYAQAVKEHNLRPVVAPKIELLKAKEKEDWQFKASFCEKPEVKLGDYKKAIRELKIKKRAKIWVPGKNRQPNNKSTKQQKKVTLDEILDTLLKKAKIDLPELLVEDQVNRMLADLLDQVQKLGLTVEQYLRARGKTIEQVKKEYKDRAIKTLSLEFALEKIADQEGIVVEDKEIEDLIGKEKDKKVREQLRTQKYYLASLLRRQKTLDVLIKT